MLCVLSSIDYYYEGNLGCTVFCPVMITIMKDIQDALCSVKYLLLL